MLLYCTKNHQKFRMIRALRKGSSFFSSQLSLPQYRKHPSLLNSRSMGGYIEEAQFAMLGLEIYQDIHGKYAFPNTSFVIPHDDDQYPTHMWGYELGTGVVKFSLDNTTNMNSGGFGSVDNKTNTKKIT